MNIPQWVRNRMDTDGKEEMHPIHQPLYPPDAIRLDLNESYWFWTEDLLSTLQERADTAAVGRYPTYEKLYAAISKHCNVNENQLCITNGSDQAITFLLELLVRNHSPMIIPSPTFAIYPHLSTVLGLQKIPIPYEKRGEEIIFPLEKTLIAMDAHSDATVFLCNPHNPFGIHTPPKIIRQVVMHAKNLHTPVVIDEAYVDFVSENGIALQELYDGVVLLRSLSKSFGMPGLRLGFVVAHPWLIRRLHQLHLPWNVNVVAKEAGILALEHREYFSSCVGKTHTLREQFSSVLTHIGFKVLPSVCNFIVAIHPDAARIQKLLREKHAIFVKPLDAYPDDGGLLKNGLRITVPGPDDIDTVIAAFKKVVNVV